FAPQAPVPQPQAPTVPAPTAGEVNLKASNEDTSDTIFIDNQGMLHQRDDSNKL
ncbi:MAG: hypothetical protein JWL85_617, partial [Candidatus Saccharibacteria bacterium]|nr:hypothetical protein [Candidatus Saccharibacteria bacterium]